MTEYCADCGKPLAAPDDIVCDVCLDMQHAMIRLIVGAYKCAFGCGEPATVTTSADDFVCEACKEVYKRDDYTCQHCGVKCVSKSVAMKQPEKSKRIIQCHHIIPYEVSQDNSLDNLITLCISCHRRLHNEMENSD